MQTRRLSDSGERPTAAGESLRAIEKGPPDGCPWKSTVRVCAYASTRLRIRPKPKSESSATPMRAVGVACNSRRYQGIASLNIS